MLNSVRILLVLLLLMAFKPVNAQGLYFPPLNPSAPWDTVSPDSLGWCTDKIAPLYSYLEQENTKGFVVLKDGKIVLEKYFGTFTADSLWYWASAGKTVTAFLVGQVQEAGQLSIADTSSKYLGQGWTGCTPWQEEKITIRHQLTMTSGLDDGVPDNHCTLPGCLQYLADPGTRWAYHNAVYTLLEKVLVSSTGQPINTLTQQNLKARTGMNGFWYTVDFDNVFFSTARSMARFGLLIRNAGAWNSDTLLHDTAYFHQMIHTSQPLNKSYGYLWWLNGKTSFMLPESQFVFPGSYAPHAPADMYAGLGKNGQIVSISPSKGIVIVRLGNPPASSGSEIPSQLCDQIWLKLSEIMCNSNSVPDGNPPSPKLQIYPNPAQTSFTVELPNQHFDLAIADLTGRRIVERYSAYGEIEFDAGNFNAGVYYVKATAKNGVVFSGKLVIVK